MMTEFDVPMVEAVTAAMSELPRLFLDTPFSDYTVIEGFLLLFLLAGFIVLIFWFFKGGF